MEVAGLSGPAPADLLDFSQMYEDINRRDLEANVQGINTYDYNLQLRAQDEASRRDAFTNSTPVRMAESIGGAAVDAVVDPVLQASGAVGRVVEDAVGGIPGMEANTEYSTTSEDMLAERANQRDIAAMDMAGRGVVAETATGIGQSLAKTAVYSRMGGLRGIYAGYMNEARREARRQALKNGATEEEAEAIGTASGVAEGAIMAAFNAVGLGGLEKAFVGSGSLNSLKKFAIQTLGELAEENVTTIAQQLAATGEMPTWKDYAKTSAQTIGAMGLVGGAPVVADRIQKFIDKPTAKNAREAGIDPRIAPTQAAREELAQGIAEQAAAMSEEQPQVSDTPAIPDQEQTPQESGESVQQSPQEGGDATDRAQARLNETLKLTPEEALARANPEEYRQLQERINNAVAESDRLADDAQGIVEGEFTVQPEVTPAAAGTPAQVRAEVVDEIESRALATDKFAAIPIEGYKLTSAEQQELVRRGLSFTTDRMNKPYAAISQRRRAEDLRAKVTSKRAPRIADNQNPAIADTPNPITPDTVLPETVSPTIQNRLTADAFREQLVAAGVRPAVADGQVRIAEVNAEFMGVPLDQLLSDNLEGVVGENWADRKGKREALGQDPFTGETLGHEAWHGSPHKFDKFTLDAMGTGEGAQAYGWGLYFAGRKEVADYYKHTLAARLANIIDWSSVDLPPNLTPAENSEFSALRNKVRKTATSEGGPPLTEAERNRYRSLKDKSDARLAAIDAATPKGALYKVDLKPTEDEYLDWDKPIGEQSESVLQKLDSAGLIRNDRYSGGQFYLAMNERDYRDRSKALQSLGIRGIRYLDGSSRGKGEGNHNYVIFDDADVAIEEVLAQKAGRARRGEIDFTQGPRAFIRLFEAQNVSTFGHEWAHLVRRMLAKYRPDIHDRISKAYGAKKMKDGTWKWSRNSEERWANANVRFLREGKSPSPVLRDVFANFKKWLTAIYKSIKGTEIGESISPEVRDVLERLYGRDSKIAPPVEAPVETFDKAQAAKVKREYARMRRQGTVGEETLDAIAALPEIDQYGIYQGATEAAALHGDYKKSLVDAFDTIFNVAGRDEYITYFTKDGKKRTRKKSVGGDYASKARMIERRGGDATSLPNFDMAVETLRNNENGEYTELLGLAETRGGGDVSNGLFQILQEGKAGLIGVKATVDYYIPDVYDHYENTKRRQAEAVGPSDAASAAGDAVEAGDRGSGDETTAEDDSFDFGANAPADDFQLTNAPSTPTPRTFDNTEGAQQTFITGRGRDLAGQETLFDPDGVADVLFQEVTDRFRGLANQTTLPEGRAANYEVDEAMGYPDRKKWADAEAAANARLAADAAGELKKFLAIIDAAEKSGGTIDLRDQADTVVLNKLKDFAAEQIGDPAKRALHRKLHQAFRMARTEQARSLGYRDPVAKADPAARNRKAITDAIADPTPEEEEARKKAKTPEEHAEVDKIFEERYNRAKKKLAALGIDIDNIDDIASDPEKSMVVLDHFRPPSTRWDMAYEYWRNSILSGPRTQITNVLGNSIFTAWNLGPERAAEAFVNLFTRDKKAASFGEFKYIAGGIFPGVMRGLRNAATAWRLETPALADELGREGAFKVDGPRGAIPGKMGRLIRAFGYRPLLAADEFAKSLIVSMEVGAHAYRAGKATGLEGEQLQQFIAEQMDDLSSYAWSAAFAKSEELTFQGKRGMVASALGSGGKKLRKIRGVRWVVPFVDTPAAIFEEGIKRIPILGAALDYAEARRGGDNIADANMTATLARQLIAAAGVAMLWAGADDDDPWVTGSAVMTKQGARDLAYRTAPPQSVKIGGQWVSYAKVEPFATAISATVDAIRGIKGGTPGTTLLFSSLQQVKNKSYLDGLGDAIDAVQEAASGDAGAAEEYAGKFAASFVPNIYRQTMSSTRGEIPERRVWGSEGDRVLRVIARTGEAMQLPGTDPETRHDIWGRPIRYSDSWGGPVTDFAWNLLSPASVKDADNSMKADLALARYNATHPDDQQYWIEPLRYVTDKKERRSLTDEQYADYAKPSGEIARYAVEQLKIDTENPTKQTISAVGNIIRRSREAARNALIPEWRETWGTGDGNPPAREAASAVGSTLLKEYAVSIAKDALTAGPPRREDGESDASYAAREAETAEKHAMSLEWLKEYRDKTPAVQAAIDTVLNSKSYRDLLLREPKTAAQVQRIRNALSARAALQ
jgi:hypothetical protein